ncbi:DUF294 nucleotidyltransferase-like domain-containing protein [Chitiniphilus purpureus]|uniref:DUF294 nucleotidyltransferase-like domain-containing protein n=1 Tax=Chitiniphilus purpureus TaxID=2981137 RepID=A0ABY6DZ26_9NEIS|nr:putative nucleotidyltransferase substrate binding domain-containing protein [Chitiniphilus sp. CD1]UXY17098.1 DUF294 nucleotidyltransferase-like domain-containing protein [Chitiniphilus sp. CD1]
MPTPFDFHQPPFDCLSGTERARLEAVIDLEYYAHGERVIGQDSPVDSLFVPMKGVIGSMVDDDPVLYHQGEAFDTRALVSGRAATSLYALEDSVLFRLPRECVLDLTQRNPLFGAFFYQDVAKRLASLAHQPIRHELQSLWLARVAQAPVRAPCWLADSVTLADAARAMQQQHLSSVLVRSADGAGIFTQSDLRDAIADGIDATGTPLASRVHRPLQGIEEDEFLYQALLLMTRQAIQRVIVTRKGEIVGVLEQVDLLAFLSNHAHLVGARIERAADTDDLQHAARDLRRMVAVLHGQGVKTTLIADLVTELQRKLLARLFAMLAPPGLVANSCLVLLGSEGRGEQVLPADQDNALLLADGYAPPVELPAITERFNTLLVQFGHPRCTGGVMLCNPAWRLSVGQCKHLLDEALDRGDGDAIMRLAIWQDAHPVCGDGTLLAQVVTHLRRWSAGDDAFLARFALAAEQFAPPPRMGGPWADKAPFDLKKLGIFPIVHGVRSLALEAGIEPTNTYRRLEALHTTGRLDPSLARDLTETLALFHALHLRHALQQDAQGRPIDYLIDPARLSPLERALLRDAFAVVRRLRERLRHHFRLAQF